jgi:hypothetical protein
MSFPEPPSFEGSAQLPPYMLPQLLAPNDGILAHPQFSTLTTTPHTRSHQSCSQSRRPTVPPSHFQRARQRGNPCEYRPPEQHAPTAARPPVPKVSKIVLANSGSSSKGTYRAPVWAVARVLHPARAHTSMDDAGWNAYPSNSHDFLVKSQHRLVQLPGVKPVAFAAGASEFDRETDAAVVKVHSWADVVAVVSVGGPGSVAVVRTSCRGDDTLEKRKAACRDVVQYAHEVRGGTTFDLVKAVSLNNLPALVVDLTVDEEFSHAGIYHAIPDEDHLWEGIGMDVVPDLARNGGGIVDDALDSGGSRRSSRGGIYLLDGFAARTEPAWREKTAAEAAVCRRLWAGLHGVPDAAVQVALVLWRCVRRLFGVRLHACTITLHVGTVGDVSLRVGEAIDEAGGNGEAQEIV